MNSKELFNKANYKFISFIKATIIDKQNVSASERNEEEDNSIKDYYLSLIKEVDGDSNKKEMLVKEKVKREKNSDLSSLIVRKEKKAPANKKGYLRAAQANDLNFIKEYLNENHLALNECDEYNWNVLMISVAAGNNQIVKYLLDSQFDNHGFDSLLNLKDFAGNDCESLASKFHNTEAIRLIQRAKQQKKVIKPTKDSRDTLNETSDTQGYHCVSCKQTYESYSDHIKSIAHQLNEDQTDSNTNLKKLKANYHLRPSNKGYQLLVKSGWNELAGLGANEQGDTRPIRAKVKLDRYGIGIKKDDTHSKPMTTRCKKLFDLKKEDNSCVAKSSRSEDNLIKKTSMNKKSKNFERNLRFYFNN